MGDLPSQIKDLDGQILPVNGVERRVKQIGVYDLSQQAKSVGRQGSTSSYPDLYTNVSLAHLQNHGGQEHSPEACPEIKFNTMEDIKTNLSDAINANHGSIKGIKKVSKEHGNVITAPLSEFKNTGDYKVPTMHNNNGSAKDLLTGQRKLAQFMDKDENVISTSEEKIKLEQEIADLEEELETLDENICLLNEEYQKQIHNEDPQYHTRVGEILLEEINKYQVAEANLKQKTFENIKTMGRHEFEMESALKKLKVKSEL